MPALAEPELGAAIGASVIRGILSRRDRPPPVLPSFAAYIAPAWQIVEPATPFVGGYHIDAIAEHLQAISDGYLQNLIINIPPRHGKSSLVSVLWPTWEWLREPSLRMLFVSYGLQLSIRDSVKRRRVIESPWYRQQAAGRVVLTSDQNQKTRFDNSATGVMLATSVGGIGTGEGGKRILVDDAHSAEEIDSDTSRQSVLDWWDGTMATRADQPDGSARVIVMQRLHERDLVGHILEQMAQGGEQYDHLVLPAEYEPRVTICLAGLDHDRRTEPGQLLSPDRFDATALERLKVSLGDRAAGQLQQRPAPPGGAIFLREVWSDSANRYDAMDELLKVQVVARWLSLDTAFKVGADNDLTGRVVLELLPDYRLLVRDIYTERLAMPGLLEFIEGDARRWNYDGKLRGIVIEDKGSGTSAGQSLEAAADPLLAPFLEMFMPIGSKVYRARQAMLWCALGCVLLPHPSAAVPWLTDFAGPEGRLFAFPTIEHDDDIDALSQGVIFLERYLSEGLRARGKATVAA